MTRTVSGVTLSGFRALFRTAPVDFWGVIHENRWVLNVRWLRGFLVAAAVLLVFAIQGTQAAETEDPGGDTEIRFDVNAITIKGNTLLPEETLTRAVASFTGKGKTGEDMDKVRAALEKLYRESGYPTVMVNIPEQNADTGIVVFDVVEARLANVEVTGNRYFTMEKILNGLPAFASGEILYLPRAQRELNQLNMNPDLKVKPVLMPGQTPGTVDVELAVTDKMPLHGSLELNNRASANTTDLRANGVIHYDNLWQKEHSLSVQFQTSPEDMDEVRALSLSYMIRAPWNVNHMMAFYSVFSDSESAFGESFKVVGEGTMAGLRYVIPLPGTSAYVHNVTAGVDHKRFKDVLYYGGEDNTADVTPVSYAPLSFAYQGTWINENVKTTLNAGLNMAPRGVAMDVSEYENKRFKARGNYIVFKSGAEIAAALPAGFGLNLKIDGQVTDQPLISNEQYSTGGMESVRGYYESEAAGDNAVSVSLEIAWPEAVNLYRRWKHEETDEKNGVVQRFKARPYVFYDMAWLSLKDPLPGEEQPGTIQGAGVGLRGYVTRYVSYGLDFGVALERTDKTEAGEGRGYARVKWAF